jgi:hypothetical protein
MANRQSRRTISFNRGLFERAKLRADLLNVPLASLAEHALERVLRDKSLRRSDIRIGSIEVPMQMAREAKLRFEAKRAAAAARGRERSRRPQLTPWRHP